MAKDLVQRIHFPRNEETGISMCRVKYLLFTIRLEEVTCQECLKQIEKTARR